MTTYDRPTPPTDGVTLYTWLRSVERRAEKAVVDILAEWGDGRSYPRLIVNWDAEQVAAGYAHITDLLRAWGCEPKGPWRLVKGVRRGGGDNRAEE